MSGSDDSSINKGRCGKSKKKFVMRIEFDDSDGSTSQDDPVVVRPSCSNGRQKRRRNRRRVISSDESDSSTDSEVIRTVIVRGRNNARAVIPEDDMDDTSPNVELDQNSIDNLNGGSSDKFLPTAMKEDGFTSDSSTDNGLEKCPICLLSFRNQEIGSPNTCDHLFCALCIEEWSRNVKTCPIDRKEFTSILVKESFENKNIVREVKIEKTEEVFIRNEEDLTRCEICNQSDREDVMLLCDGCNHGFHMDCLTPALTEIPEGFWYCDNCFESESDASSDNFELLYEDLREIGVPRTRLRIREVQQPRITRTRQSERIRASIVRTRASRNPQSNTRDAVETTASTSRQRVQNIQEVSISRATTLLRTKPRKRRTRTRRYKTYVVEYDLNTSEKFPIKTTKKLIKRRRRRRRRKTRRSNSNRLSNNSRCQEASLGRAEIGVTFSLFGNANELEYFSDESDVTDTLGVGRGEAGVATMASARANRYSTSTLLRQKGVLGNLDRRSNFVNVRSDPTPAQQPDVLSNILEMQSFWHSSAASRTLNEVKINPDGSLNLPKTSESSEKENTQINISSQSKGTDSSTSVENNITQAPMYPRGGNHNYSNRGGGGNYNNRFNNQSSGFRNSNNSNFSGNSSTNFRHSTGGLGGSGFNSFQRDNNFQPEHFQPRLYGSPDFRNRQRNQNNTQNNRRNFIQFSYNNNLLPPSSNLTGSANANSINANPLFQNNNNISFDTSIAPSSNTALREIGPQLPSPEDPQYSLIVKLNQSDASTKDDSENSKSESGGADNTNDALDIPLPLYSPTSNFNETEIKLSDANDTDKDIDGKNPQNNDEKASNSIPPLQPPPWNNNLFRLAASYDDQDDDEDCPNFSVYSAESFQVARSAESAVPESSDKDRQEDEYEEKQEDLVQLGDDDEIPNAIVNRKVERAQTDSDIYDPEDPNNDDYSERDTEDNENHIHDDEAIASPTTSDKDDKEDEPKVSEFEKDVEKLNADEKEEEEDSEDISEDQKIIESDRSKISKNKKGVLELYDDSDWEEWNIDKSEVYKSTKPQITEPEVKIDSEPADDVMTVEVRKPEDEKSDIANKETAESVSDVEEEEERSYTPCLDEKVDHSDAIRGEESPTREFHLEEKSEDEGRTAGSSQKGDDSDRAGTPPGRILGLETELISDEDEGILNEVQSSVVGVDRKKDGQDKKTKKGQFKKISKNTKVRNYRDKDGIKRKRSNRSRSRSDDKENRGDDKSSRKKTRRKDMERYDVRNVINQPRSYKDRYGRDTSRPPRSRSGSRATRSKSRARSISRRIRSISRSRSVRRSFSMSPTPPSYGKYTPQSRSPRRSRSIRRSRSYRRSPVAKRRGKSPVRARSLVRRRSVPRGRSPFRARSPQRLRSPVHARTPIRPRSRSFTQSPRSRSPSFPCSISGSPPIQSKRVYRKRRSQSNSISRSRSPVTKKNRSRSLRKTSKEKRKRSKDRKKKKTKRHSIRESPVATKRPPRRVDHNTEPVRKKKRRTRSRSPVEERFSQTPPASTAPINTDPSWTPPLASSNSENLRVILNNKELLAKKKKEKKKKIEKRREKSTNKERRKRRSQIPESPVAPSKEVFASGDNILVSVSFNKENAQPQQTTVVTLPPTREEIVSRRSPERPHRKIKKKDKVQKRHKKIDAKPVAIIDLDRSPFQVIAQSPKDVIILTDSEREAEEEEETSDMNTRKNNVEIQTLERSPIDMRMEGTDKNINVERSEKSAEKTFDMPQLGPKTPPEPPIVKFSLATKIKQIKSRNPLHEQEDIEDEIPEKSHNEEDNQQINKIGPNTPPESGPCSPDAYDPFDPTKSPSASPSTPPPAEIPQSLPDADSNVNDMGSDKRDSRPIGQDKNLNPVDLVMALMTSKQSLPQDVCKVNPETSYINSSAEINDDKPDETSMNTKSISVLSNVLITPGKHSNIPPISSPQNISKLSITKQPTGRINGGASNEDMFEDLESPYSPGSADYEDLFEPPPENPRARSSKTNNKSNKVDIFDHLFGSSPVARMQGGKKRQPKQQLTQQQILQQHRKYSVRVSKLPGVGMDQEQIKIYDDLPSSAVELQVKDKYVRKLHRQERVVEEVKLVLKPYYTKKVINKEVYKEILRRSVPKICHSRSGEINPKKIQNLVEAYVRKFRQKLKLSMLSNTGQVSSASKCAAYLKKL